MTVMRWCTAFLAVVLGGAGADLTVLPDYVRIDPSGAIVEADQGQVGLPSRAITLESARAAYVSCQLVAQTDGGREYELSVRPFPPASGLAVEWFREWFHFTPKDRRYYPDALIPLSGAHRSRIPEPDNKIAGQRVQAFWLDIWVPAETRPGSYETIAELRSGGHTTSVPIAVRVLEARVPDDDAVAIDHNTYGTSWLAAQYPRLRERLGDSFFASDEFFDLIHAFHRIFYEHRGVFHQLGYGHAGKVGPEFAPRLAGSGKTKRIADWTLYDRHYGPLLDGSAFRATRRGARPIPFVYLPINPEWPASYLWWGEPGYEREFVNVVSGMERHFREKDWTRTRFELFFNHKKRYKGFPWDGDEARFPSDYAYMREYARLMKLAVPAGSPVKFVFRADVSWTMERQFRELAGVVDFWVCGAGMFGWYDGAARMLKQRGDIVWIYGGTPPVTRPTSFVTVDVLRTWLWGVDGFVRWLTTAPGDDPWFRFEGGGEALVYPGERFGIEAPIPSIRLKIERNAVQDVTLLDAIAKTRGIDALRREAAEKFNHTALEEWRARRPALANTNPEDWTNADIDDAMPKNPKFDRDLDAGAWDRVHAWLMGLAREVR
jgi:hypothetical protein